MQLPIQLIGFGGLRAIDLKVGETVIVAPATGGFSGAAVQVAVAMGANVIAVGRSSETLEVSKAAFPPGRVRTVQTTGDVEKDTAALKQWGPVDAYIDVSPVQASGSDPRAFLLPGSAPVRTSRADGRHVERPHDALCPRGLE